MMMLTSPSGDHDLLSEVGLVMVDDDHLGDYMVEEDAAEVQFEEGRVHKYTVKYACEEAYHNECIHFYL
jgi:hypothetical protein